MKMKNHGPHTECIRGSAARGGEGGRWLDDVQAPRHAQLGVVIELVTPTDCTHE